MKTALIVICSFLMLSCSNDFAPGCIQTRGPLVETSYELPAFESIIVFDRVQLIIKQDEVQSVVVETGENLLGGIDIKVENGVLSLRDHNSCNLVRPYAATKVYVSIPNLANLRNSSEYEVQSVGVLKFNSLHLISEDHNNIGYYHNNGDFNLNVECEFLKLTLNGSSNVYLEGSAKDLEIGLFSGSSRVEGRQLKAQNVELFHRSSNDVILNVEQSLTGELRSTGNLILVRSPEFVDIQRFYTGQLFYE